MYVLYVLVTPFDEVAPGVLYRDVAKPEPLSDRLKRLAKEAGMSGDELVFTAYDTDREGYAFSTLREMLYGKRAFQLRALIAFAKALDIPATDFPEYPLHLVRYLTDEQIHGSKVAMANLESLEIKYLPELSRKQIESIPINHRQSRKDPAKASGKAAGAKRRSGSG